MGSIIKNGKVVFDKGLVLLICLQ